MSKKIVCVRFEGTICDTDKWELIPKVKEQLERLSHDFEVIVVSAESGTSLGRRRVRQFLHDHDLKYDDIWEGFCLPPHDLYVDANAVKRLEAVK